MNLRNWESERNGGRIYRDNKQRNLERFFIVALFNKATKEAAEKERKCLSWLCGSQWREEVKVCLWTWIVLRLVFFWFVVRRSQSSLFLSLRMRSLLRYNSVSILGVHYAIFQPLATVIISTNTLTSLEKVSIPSIFGRLAAVRGRYASRRIYWSRKWCT